MENLSNCTAILVNREFYLNKYPGCAFKPFEDLIYIFIKPDGGIVTEEEMKNIDISVDNLYEVAINNFDMQYEPACFPSDNTMLVTTTEKVYGATLMQNMEVLEHAYEEFGQSFYILPSSMHELIFYACEEGYEDELKRIVKEVNDTEYVSDDILLSYNIYFYDRVKKEVRMV